MFRLFLAVGYSLMGWVLLHFCSCLLRCPFYIYPVSSLLLVCSFSSPALAGVAGYDGLVATREGVCAGGIIRRGSIIDLLVSLPLG